MSRLLRTVAKGTDIALFIAASPISKDERQHILIAGSPPEKRNEGFLASEGFLSIFLYNQGYTAERKEGEQFQCENLGWQSVSQNDLAGSSSSREEGRQVWVGGHNIPLDFFSACLPGI